MSDTAELERVVELYSSGQYELCTNDLGRLLDATSARPFVDPNVIERGRLYFASCALLDGREAPAREALRDALGANPLMQPPDSLTFPPPVVSLFLEIREEFRAKIFEQEQAEVARLVRENEEARKRALAREARERELVRLAMEQPVVVRSSRFVASLPFGAGQYQNDDRALGNTFLVTEILFGATAIVGGVVLADFYTQAAGRQIPEDQKFKFDAAHTVLTIGSWGFLTTAALGILEAHLNFQSERVTGVQKRALPPHLVDPEPPSTSRDGGTSSRALEPRVVPFGGPTADGAIWGFTGTF